MILSDSCTQEIKLRPDVLRSDHKVTILIHVVIDPLVVRGSPNPPLLVLEPAPTELVRWNCSFVAASRVPGPLLAGLLIVVVKELGEVEEYLAPEWDLGPMIEQVLRSSDTP